MSFSPPFPHAAALHSRQTYLLRRPDLPGIFASTRPAASAQLIMNPFAMSCAVALAKDPPARMVWLIVCPVHKPLVRKVPVGALAFPMQGDETRRQAAVEQRAVEVIIGALKLPIGFLGMAVLSHERRLREFALGLQSIRPKLIFQE